MLNNREKNIQMAVSLLVDRQIRKNFSETDYTLQEIVRLVSQWYDGYSHLIPVEIVDCILEFGDVVPELSTYVIREVVAKYA